MPTPEDSGTRKLAAIMFTDVKSFSKKMGENEEAAMELLRTHDTIMKEVVEKWGGKVIKSIGDSFMVDFSSAVNAVRCAIEAQESFWKLNQGKVEFEKIEIRVGIHLGDVIMVENDIYGDGVNIAARIEAITEPNRICVSQDIYNQVKNKMQLNAFSIGSMELKNIAEPVEVFEILIDSIPELSKPSASAQKAPSRRAAEAITKQEAQEAKKVEEAKQKAAEERRRADEEKQKKVHAHYAKAQEYLQAKDLEKSEAEVKAIYNIVAIHPGAQMIQMQIDEERFRVAEEERRHRIEEENRKAQERAQEIDGHLKKALECVEKDQLSEALESIQKVFELEPNHPEGKRLEEEIRQLEQAKIELERSKALAEEEAKQEVAPPEVRPGVRGRVQVAVPSRAELKRKKKKNTLALGGAGVGIFLVAFAIVYFTVPEFHKLFAGKAGSVAVLPFEMQDSSPDVRYVGQVLAAIFAEHLGRSAELTVIAPYTAASFTSGKQNNSTISSELGVRALITGSMTATDGRMKLHVELLNAEKGERVWEGSFEGEITSSQLWSDILLSVQNELGISISAGLRTGTNSTSAFQLYLKAVGYLQLGFRDSLPVAKALLDSALALDGSFAQAHAAQALLSLEVFKRGGEVDKALLRDALQSGQTALRLNSDLPSAYTSVGEAYRYLQRLQDAKSNLAKSLTMLPNGAEANRQLALLSMMEGDLVLAATYAATAQRLDPKYYETYVVLGLVSHLKNELEAALSSYERAITLGGNDSLITIRYRFGTWSGLYQNERVSSYCLPLSNNHPEDYRVYYWLGRSYQLSGKLFDALEYYGKGIALTQKILELNPDDADARAFQGFMLYLSGKAEQGEFDVERAAALIEGSAEAMYWRARIYAIQNKKAEALSWLRKAVALDFQFAQVLNPDFVALARDPEFLPTIARKSPAEAPTGN